MKKTKIICSIGPSSYNYDVFLEMAKAGMNVARVNFSHADIRERKLIEDLVERCNKELDLNIAILYDTKGPDIRTGKFENDRLSLVAGQTIKIVKEEVLGSTERISINFPQLIDVIEIGQKIYLDDGLIRLEVIDKTNDYLLCNIIDSAIINGRRGVNVPGVILNTPFISEEDEKDIEYACRHNGDFLALSFVSQAADVREVKRVLDKYNCSSMKIITKIESASAIANFDEILAESDGVMIARGDLGIEMPMAELPILQKNMLKKAELENKICIVATEMLASMYINPRPTRAELTDVANAVFDGADSLMLSGETTIGRFPVEAVKYMSEISKKAEESAVFNLGFIKRFDTSITDMITTCAISSAKNLEAKLIVTPTMSGYTAQQISELKPSCHILALCPNNRVARSLALSYGVHAKVIDLFPSTDELLEDCKKEAKKFVDLKTDDIIIITGGFPTGEKNQTNFLKIEKI